MKSYARCSTTNADFAETHNDRLEHLSQEQRERKADLRKRKFELINSSASCEISKKIKSIFHKKPEDVSIRIVEISKGRTIGDLWSDNSYDVENDVDVKDEVRVKDEANVKEEVDVEPIKLEPNTMEDDSTHIKSEVEVIDLTLEPTPEPTSTLEQDSAKPIPSPISIPQSDESVKQLSTKDSQNHDSELSQSPVDSPVQSPVQPPVETTAQPTSQPPVQSLVQSPAHSPVDSTAQSTTQSPAQSLVEPSIPELITKSIQQSTSEQTSKLNEQAFSAKALKPTSLQSSVPQTQSEPQISQQAQVCLAQTPQNQVPHQDSSDNEARIEVRSLRNQTIGDMMKSRSFENEIEALKIQQREKINQQQSQGLQNQTFSYPLMQARSQNQVQEKENDQLKNQCYSQAHDKSRDKPQDQADLNPQHQAPLQTQAYHNLPQQNGKQNPASNKKQPQGLNQQHQPQFQAPINQQQMLQYQRAFQQQQFQSQAPVHQQQFQPQVPVHQQHFQPQAPVHPQFQPQAPVHKLQQQHLHNQLPGQAINYQPQYQALPQAQIFDQSQRLQPQAQSQSPNQYIGDQSIHSKEIIKSLSPAQIQNKIDELESEAQRQEDGTSVLFQTLSEKVSLIQVTSKEMSDLKQIVGSQSTTHLANKKSITPAQFQPKQKLIELELKVFKLKDEYYSIHEDYLEKRAQRSKTVDAKKFIYGQPAYNITDSLAIGESFNGWIKTLPSERSRKSERRKIFAIDCETVLCDGNVIQLGQVSIINWQNEEILTVYVKPDLKVKNYNTKITGLTKDLLFNNPDAWSFKQVQNFILETIKTRDIIVGHAIHNDLNYLKLVHPRIIDTQILYPNFINSSKSFFGSRPSLKNLSKKYLLKDIQIGPHDPMIDAKSTLDLVKVLNYTHKLRQRPIKRLSNQPKRPIIENSNVEDDESKCQNDKVKPKTVMIAHLRAVNNQRYFQMI
ncbi:RNA exonuclease 3 [Wickerhamomyces ciferrii]|uniref:RNA exonuclease 3 n=1 Tax=Wickerhamomyces ciferrii (strain ATCC 14091 / BCRC 22168 / CBS 111 / JCM 3599 / NBRC 0793 / NRRL Y-1031 F-60-10) TaxID=1206466 RepID=K0KPP5_WICCF|nr:RNA exonuclease 3 [Wickerhamomyces ciferrii]CCH44976.1 RNA exonuclease 3 [Wickerhamomyces ciferrii]